MLARLLSGESIDSVLRTEAAAPAAVEEAAVGTTPPAAINATGPDPASPTPVVATLRQQRLSSGESLDSVLRSKTAAPAAVPAAVEEAAADTTPPAATDATGPVPAGPTPVVATQRRQTLVMHKEEAGAKLGMKLAKSGPGRKISASAVADGGIAAAAGLRAGDVILEVDGKPMASNQEMAMALGSASGSVEILIERAEVEAEPAPEPAASLAPTAEPAPAPVAEPAPAPVAEPAPAPEDKAPRVKASRAQSSRARASESTDKEMISTLTNGGDRAEGDLPDDGASPDAQPLPAPAPPTLPMYSGKVRAAWAADETPQVGAAAFVSRAAADGALVETSPEERVGDARRGDKKALATSTHDPNQLGVAGLMAGKHSRSKLTEPTEWLLAQDGLLGAALLDSIAALALLRPSMPHRLKRDMKQVYRKLPPKARLTAETACWSGDVDYGTHRLAPIAKLHLLRWCTDIVARAVAEGADVAFDAQSASRRPLPPLSSKPADEPPALPALPAPAERPASPGGRAAFATDQLRVLAASLAAAIDALRHEPGRYSPLEADEESVRLMAMLPPPARKEAALTGRVAPTTLALMSGDEQAALALFLLSLQPRLPRSAAGEGGVYHASLRAALDTLRRISGAFEAEEVPMSPAVEATLASLPANILPPMRGEIRLTDEHLWPIPASKRAALLHDTILTFAALPAPLEAAHARTARLTASALVGLVGAPYPIPPAVAPQLEQLKRALPPDALRALHRVAAAAVAAQLEPAASADGGRTKKGKRVGAGICEEDTVDLSVALRAMPLAQGTAVLAQTVELITVLPAESAHGADQVRLARLLAAVIAQLNELKRLPYLTAVQRAEIAQLLLACPDNLGALSVARRAELLFAALQVYGHVMGVPAQFLYETGLGPAPLPALGAPADAERSASAASLAFAAGAGVRTYERRALLIGVSMPAPGVQLRGCDAALAAMRGVLADAGYDVRALCDWPADQECAPTSMARIMSELEEAAAWTRGGAGRQLWVHVCGYPPQLYRSGGGPGEILGAEAAELAAIVPSDADKFGVITAAMLTDVLSRVAEDASAMVVLDGTLGRGVNAFPYRQPARPPIVPGITLPNPVGPELLILCGMSDLRLAPSAYSAANQGSWFCATTVALVANCRASQTVGQLLENCRATMRRSGWILTPTLFAPELDLAADFSLVAT